MRIWWYWVLKAHSVIILVVFTFFLFDSFKETFTESETIRDGTFLCCRLTVAGGTTVALHMYHVYACPLKTSLK